MKDIVQSQLSSMMVLKPNFKHDGIETKFLEISAPILSTAILREHRKPLPERIQPISLQDAKIPRYVAREHPAADYNYTLFWQE